VLLFSWKWILGKDAMLTAEANIETTANRSSFDLTDARDELNISEWPLFYLGQRLPSDTKTLTYENTVYDVARNRTRKRKLEIVGSDAYGLPTMRDADVLLALMLIAKQRNNFTTPTVTFTRSELVEILGWGDSGRSYERIEEALKKWMSITLFFKDSWWDREKSQWKTEGFHLLEHMSISDRQGNGKQHELPLSSCTFSNVFFSSLHKGNIKRLNLTEWFSLTVPAAKQMYRFLDKRFHSTSKLEFDLRAFACGHVGFSKEYPPAKLKEKLKPAIAELVAIGFIEDVPTSQRYSKVGHGEWKIHFTRKRAKLLDDVPLKGTKTERSQNRLLIKELVDRGMTPATARQLVEDPTIPHERIKNKIELLDWMTETNDVETPVRPGGWLRKAIEEDYQPPKTFKTTAERKAKNEQIEAFKLEREHVKNEKDRREDEQRKREMQEQRQRWERVEAYLESLRFDEREQLIEAAMHDPQNEFCREFAKQYHREKTPGGMEECMYQVALVTHVLPKIPTPEEESPLVIEQELLAD
jgi:hypothetical protein